MKMCNSVTKQESRPNGVTPELQNEIPVQVGKYDTNRITEARESGNTKTDGTRSTCLFCYGRKSRRGKERKDGEVFGL